MPDEAAAARCYLAAEQPLPAAQNFLAAGDRGSAAQALQQIAEDDPDFERATLLLVPLLIDEGVFEGALHRFSLLSQEPTLTGSMTVDRYYWEGRALEGAGRITEAAQAYQRTVAMRRDHRDASGLARCRARSAVARAGPRPVARHRDDLEQPDPARRHSPRRNTSRSCAPA